MTYNPNLGRWLQTDPIGLDGGDANLYRFVGNSPTNAVDPSGKIGIFFDGFRYKAEDNTIIGAMYAKYDGKKEHYMPDAGDNMKQVEAAYKKIQEALTESSTRKDTLCYWTCV